MARQTSLFAPEKGSKPRRGWATGNQRCRGKATESFFIQIGELMFAQGIALVVKAESVWRPVMGTAEDGSRKITGARPDRSNAGVPDFFAVLGAAGGYQGLFFEAKECAGRRLRLGDPKILRPAQRDWMDRVNGDVGSPALTVPCFLLVRFPEQDRIYRLPWSVARRLDALDSKAPEMDCYLVDTMYLASLRVATPK